MRVRQLMTPTVHWVRPNGMLSDAACMMKDLDISSLPIGTEGQFVGIITETDVTRRATAQGLDPTKTIVRDVMTLGVVYCIDTASWREAFEIMDETGIRHLVVKDDRNQVVGILSLADLAFKVPAELFFKDDGG